MKRFKKIISYIPHNSSDAVILYWCGKIASYAKSSFVHLVICYEDFYEGLQNSDLTWEDFVKQEESRITQLAKERITEVDFNIIILNEAPLKGVLELLASGSYDLLILPKESTYGISLVEKLARKSPVAVLVVPEGSIPIFNSILLGADFSDLTPLSLDLAEAFAAITPSLAELHAHHVYNVPRTSKALQATNPNRLRAHLHDVSLKMLEDFIADNAKLKSEWCCEVSEYPIPSNALIKAAKTHSCDLIVIGSHGRNALSVALLGGQTSDILRETPVPLLIAKRKNESLGFLKQLLGINS